ncbi:Replicative DNA helicase [Candidatus Ornithobacterium hominis]|uniref:DNA 5'-3' helicase n=1 Tax=Candidatus Ornithobacterium hominis TaxID=2497989 RepID=A0A383U4P2_9FLAO|nr:replicative DNA helicase [Candidatus Ornithobacterium hominis]MCT7905250.1 replicative DNA helicase [Candidatus Ornithobacterium hominis]SZD74349.1 Replicative DNA helicase [Candidatus Ornithobacterium hominis]
MKKNLLQDIKIEKSILGAFLNSPALFGIHYSKLSENLFTENFNKVVFNVMKNFYISGQEFDFFIINNEISKLQIQESTLLLTQIFQYSLTSNIEYHIMILVELEAKRDFVNKFNTLIRIAADPKSDIFELRERTFNDLDKLFIDKFIDNNRFSKTFAELIEIAQEKFLSIDSTTLTGIPSSLNLINKTIGGWQNSDLSIIAGRPGMGKTAFLVQQVVDIALQSLPIAVFSLEMSAEQITNRIITNITSIPNSSLLRKGLNKDELKHYFRKKELLQNLSIYIDDTAGITLGNIRIKAKMLKMRHDIKIIFIDYLQLISVKNAQHREQEISTISRGLKQIAKELEVPVIALSQLSRAVENRPDKRPKLSDLRESGAIEQDADEVLFLYRPEYYGIEEWHEYNNESTENQLEINIAKNRNGGTNYERVGVNLATSQFSNLNFQ